MAFPRAAWLVALFLAGSDACGGPAPGPSPEPTEPPEKATWEYSASLAAYLAAHAQDYANPTLTADRDWLHLELRYNYEALRTGSAWIGYNFSFGRKLAFELTPMLGGVFGDINGVAPGYTISVTYGPLELFTQGEYFFDTGTSEENFFYNWSEFTVAPARWVRVGLVLDRTKALGENTAIRRGPLLGFTYKQFDFTTYCLSPGSRGMTFVLSTTITF